jgi:uncharacterized protein with ParB-like and HNH nuclease domain
MSYANSTLLSILNKIENHQVCLPSIQRKFEWGMDRIEMLFDSIMNDYPIGTFLIWNVSEPATLQYKFFEVNNTFDLSEGQWQKPRPAETSNDSLWALLDGQQRLTSISIGLQGSYSYAKGKNRITKLLYFNLIKNNESDDYKSFKFFKQGQEQKDPDNLWIPASMFVKTLKDFYNSVPEDVSKYVTIEKIIKDCIQYKNEEIKKIWEGWVEKNNYLRIGSQITKFAEKIGKDSNQIFSYYLINNSVDLDVCNEIFVRINSGGVKLSKADLLFSTVVSTWEDGRTHVDNLIKVLKSKGYQVDTEFIMRACLYLVNSDILFKIDSFNGNTVNKIINSFLGKDEKEIGIYEAIIQTFDYLKNKLHVPDKILKSKNVLIPIVHHIFHGGKLGDESILEVQKFIYISLIQKVFGSHGDTLLKDLRKGVTNHNDKTYELLNRPFDFKTVISQISEDAKRNLYNIDLAWAERILKIEKGNDSWLVLSLIYGDLPYEYQAYDQDHLHPVSSFKKKTFPGDYERSKTLFNTIPNLGFSTPEDNRLKKNAHPLHHYLENILKNQKPELYSIFRSINKIDNNVSLELADFETFYNTRKEKLFSILKEKFNLKEGTNTSNLIDDDEYPDIEENESFDILNEETILMDEALEEIIPVNNPKVESNDSNKPDGFSDVQNSICKILYQKLSEEKFGFMSGVFVTEDIYNAVKVRYPELCIDSYRCIQNCKSGNDQPEWKHKVRSALERFKTTGVVMYDNINRRYTI